MKKENSLRIENGLFLKRSRISKSLTGFELAKKLNISQQQISRYERGQTSINIETLDLILKTLDKEWSEFLFVVIDKYTEDAYDFKVFN